MAGASRNTFVEAVLALLDALESSGRSMRLSLGGVIAITMHGKAPGRLASLVLADTFASHPDGREHS
jgi:3-oxoadipate enol-lactonase